jgi:hypothetical protein
MSFEMFQGGLTVLSESEKHFISQNSLSGLHRRPRLPIPVARDDLPMRLLRGTKIARNCVRNDTMLHLGLDLHILLPGLQNPAINNDTIVAPNCDSKRQLRAVNSPRRTPFSNYLRDVFQNRICGLHQNEEHEFWTVSPSRDDLFSIGKFGRKGSRP